VSWQRSSWCCADTVCGTNIVDIHEFIGQTASSPPTTCCHITNTEEAIYESAITIEEKTVTKVIFSRWPSLHHAGAHLQAVKEALLHYCSIKLYQ